MKIVICDDEPYFHNKLKKYIDSYAKSKALAVIYFDFLSGEELVKYLYSHNDIDVIFMDYQMKPLSGLETSKKIIKLNINIPIIFLTNFPDIVFDTFEVRAFRFLIKPINPKKLSEALNNLLNLYSSDNYILVTENDIFKRININEIFYIEAKNKSSIIRLKDKTINCHSLLSKFENELPKDKFFRTHKSFLVGFKYISEYNSSQIIFTNGEKARISRYRFSDFKESYFNYMKRYLFEVTLP
ncbi:MAG: LytTR family DNA-binding domain-containing protein [Ruminococcus flavefaciens]|nr:LytTR family DNA-binding domain-containing protein [Ruminococcus flavefaciens]